MQVSQALNPRRISRSLVTILALTLLETVLPPVVAPLITTPQSHAVTGTIVPSTSASGASFTIPAGVTSVTLSLVGGAGGKGGDDGNIGKNGTTAGRVGITISVSPGDVLGLFAGNAGSAGASGTGNAGGNGGADTLPGSAFSINGTYFQGMNFGGGSGGAAGSQGSSGSGGGAGAASIATINSEIVAIAGGAGGGGGAGTNTNYAVDWNGTLQPNGSNFYGTTGTSLNFSNSCPGSNGNGDGGGGGGGGGGYYGGLGGTAPKRVDECSGTSGSPGGNYLASRATVVRNDLITTTSEGSVVYTYDVDAVSACSTNSQTVDIYTVQKITTTANCTWTVPSNVSVIDLFLIGGGGGGSGDGGGGGGGGASLSRTAIPVTANSTLNLKVGYGGAGTSWGYSYNAITGDSTTVTLAAGTTFSALGGSGGTSGPSGASGAGGVASNGGFSGGNGGSGGSCFNVGTTGARGVSNYFYGTLNTYAGGGGGGSCPNGAATTGAAGADGGGTGGYASSASVNQPGSDAIVNRGGGGGGGVATGSGLKLQGGKGGSGVILIRYATDSADAFPASVASSLAGRWTPSDLQLLDSARKGWVDSSGSYANASITGSPIVTTQTSLDSGNSTGSTKTNLIAAGGTTDKTTLIAGTLSNYTILHVARYPRTKIAGGAITAGRLMTASGGNFISGHYNASNESNAHHDNGWITPTGTATQYKWLLSTDMAKLYRANGKGLTYKSDVAAVLNAVGPTGFGINNYASEPTDWQMTDILVFNRQLTIGEVKAMENYLARIYGLSIDVSSTSSDTDTATTMGSTSGNYYYFNGLGVGNTFNDTFTLETWVKPESICETGLCMLLARENTILFGVSSGILYWQLNGSNIGQEWRSTGVRVKAGEWSHLAIVKDVTGSKFGSLKFYLNGKLAYTEAGSPYIASDVTNSTSSTYKLVDADNNWFFIGGRPGASQYFYGDVDEVKVWKIARTASDIALDMHSNDSTNTNLQMYYNFNMDSPTNAVSSIPVVQNLAAGGVARSDLYSYYATSFPTIEVRENISPYARITFPRTIITKNGGWKAPSGVLQVQTVVVGGGGGGGGGYQGGGGGGGGFVETLTTLVTGSIYPIKVGTGGIGHSTPNLPTSGETSTAFGISAAGGGYGSSEYDNAVPVNVSRLPSGGGSGGGGGWVNGGSTAGALGIPGQGNNGGNGGYGTCCTAAGGGGAGSAGSDGTQSKGGNGGAGKLSAVTGTILAAGGGGSLRSATTTAGQGLGGSSIGGNSGFTSNAQVGASGGATNGAYGTGSGGGAGLSTNGQAASYSGSGGTGVVALRYITSLVPSYTKPTNAYLNVGMTETFTTNIAVDSATAGLTRTFKWESTTPTANGAYTVLKSGTGAANAAYSWVPSDTSTTGSGYLYRLTVTDSDTAGLFITDSSTAFAVINPALKVASSASSNTLAKKINVSRNETFTITLGTPTYRATLSPVIAGITIDTSTAGSVILKIGDTATVGTWLETLTVTDSVSANVVVPLSITVAAPPVLTNTAAVITNGQVFAFDPGNSASYNYLTNSLLDVSGSKHPITINNGGTYNSDYSGILSLNTSSSQYLSSTGFTQMNTWTIETWIRIDASTSGFCPLTSEYAPTNISFALCVDAGRTFYTGFHNGNWTYKRSNEVIPLNTWTHLVGTFDGSNINLYINGVSITVKDSGTGAGYTPPQPSTDRVFLGKWFDTPVGTTASVSYGPVRLYNVGFTQANTISNYNATKDRFAALNQTQIKPSKKYGVFVLESFTATSGSETRTITFATGNRTGILWDTTTVTNQIQLSIQESLSAGTYFDTVTVTDNLGQSTYLPITFTVTKADTITVTSGPSLTTVYTGTAPTNGPVARVTGLVGFDTATVTTSYTSAPGTTCATGGSCSIGDIGPGGGYVFYISGTAIDSATGISDGGTYLEVAPLGWSTPGSEYQGQWAAALTSVTGTSRSVGQGAENTRKIIAALPSTTNLAKVTADLTYGGKSDWFFPSSDEVKAMYTNLFAASKGDFSASNYWGSTQDDLNSSPSRADTYWFGAGNTYSPTSKTNSYYLRPIRAFTPGAITITSTPTDVDTYTATGTNLTFSVGSVSNYQAVVYETSTLKITQANQNKLVLNLYGAVAGSPFTLVTTGGSGDGAVTETVTAGSTATNCSISNRILSNSNSATQQFYCNVLITKASSRNYKSESLTASVYFMVYLNSQPSNQAGSGSTIGLNGVTSLETSTVLPPAITSLSVSTLSLSSGITTFTITGSGFTGTITVKFWRNKIISATSSNGTTIDIPVSSISSAGATSGRIAVITSAGEAVSVDSLTITP